MKLMRYSGKTELPVLARMGVLVGEDTVADLRAGHARFLAEQRGNPKGEEIAAIFMPPYITQFLHLGESGWEAVAETHAFLAELALRDPSAPGLRGEQLFTPLAECRLYAPVRPGKLIAVGRNYPGVGGAKDEAKSPPTGFIKVASTVVGPGRDIVRPHVTEDLGCEAELAIVIGRKCKHVPEARANEVIAGYTILNDVTARDIADAESREGYALLGKCFDTFAPLGPWLVTRDEIPDPMSLRIRTRVNGTLRQDASTASMLHPVAHLVAYFSQMTLMPGDVIATGSPPPLPSVDRRSLEAGDLIEAEIEKVGVLRNAVVDEPD